MKTVEQIMQELAAPFDPKEVQWRVGSTNKRNFEAKKADKRKGQALAYIDARNVFERLDAVVGLDGWQSEQIPMHNGTFCCRLSIRVGNMWVSRTDGAGPTGDIGNENAREMAQKGGYSDSIKRAAVQFGIGQYLYGLDSPWLELNEYWGIPKEAYGQLDRLLRGQAEPSARSQKATGGAKDNPYTTLEKGLRAAAKRGEKAFLAYWKDEGTQKLLKGLSSGWLSSINEEKDKLKKQYNFGASPKTAPKEREPGEDEDALEDSDA